MSSSKAPVISVVMAAHNGAAFIADTVRSVLAQGFADFELIVVDDRSPDDTLAVLAGIADPRLRVIASPVNEGPVRTRNQGFALARGRYIAALDQDDLCLHDRFARQVAFLDAHPEVLLVGAAAEMFYVGGPCWIGKPARTTPMLLAWLLLLKNPLVWSSVMFRRDAARRLDPVTRPEMLFAEDYDLYHRLARLGPIARLDEVLLRYRCHAGGASQRHRDRMIDSAAAVLADAYRPLLGDEAGDAARLVAVHLGASEPVPDGATLGRLASIVERLWRAFAHDRAIDADSRQLIESETTRLWSDLVGKAIRTGAVGWREARTAVPAPMRSLDLSLHEVVVATALGRGRAVRARFG